VNQDLALKVLSQIMSWDDERARKEFSWLKLMARLKYDGYRDFQAGMRFTESLATWLQQFSQSERETAYDFVRNSLVYVGPSEMQRLVEQFYPRIVRDRLECIVSTNLNTPKFTLFNSDKARAEIDRLKRQTLFMGLSDGARIDGIRHANVGLLKNEQFVLQTQLDKDKWLDLLQKLREDLNDDKALFKLVYLIDDFAGTGTSFIRYNEKKLKWTGKLCRFKDSIESASSALGSLPFDPSWELCIHHYIGSASAKDAIHERELASRVAIGGDGWAKKVHISFGSVLPKNLPINEQADRYKEFIDLTNTYYDPVIRTEHTDVGGAPHLGLGYGGCALPLILNHNTPNNSIALLWAETDGNEQTATPAPAMRPLFRRRQRHT